LEKAVIEQVQEQILSPENVRRYIEMALGRAGSDQEPSLEEKALLRTIEDTDAKLRRWEDALERGLLSLDDAAHRIKSLRQERTALLKTKATLEKSRSRAKILPIPTPLMAGFVKQMQARLTDKKIGYNKEFLREIIKEVRIRGKEVILTYKIPLTPRKTTGENPREEFFTVSHLVEAGGIEPPSESLPSPRLHA
jgi:signal transduction protein with GAF and PtsI domain